MVAGSVCLRSYFNCLFPGADDTNHYCQANTTGKSDPVQVKCESIIPDATAAFNDSALPFFIIVISVLVFIQIKRSIIARIDKQSDRICRFLRGVL